MSRATLAAVGCGMVALLAGCTMGPPVYEKPDVSLTDAERDRAECSKRRDLQ